MSGIHNHCLVDNLDSHDMLGDAARKIHASASHARKYSGNRVATELLFIPQEERKYIGKTHLKGKMNLQVSQLRFGFKSQLCKGKVLAHLTPVVLNRIHLISALKEC